MGSVIYLCMSLVCIVLWFSFLRDGVKIIFPIMQPSFFSSYPSQAYFLCDMRKGRNWKQKTDEIFSQQSICEIREVGPRWEEMKLGMEYIVEGGGVWEAGIGNQVFIQLAIDAREHTQTIPMRGEDMKDCNSWSIEPRKKSRQTGLELDLQTVVTGLVGAKHLFSVE